MPDHFSRTPHALTVVILVMLASVTVLQSAPRFSEASGVDFYHFWGVPVARRLTLDLGSPYREDARYAAVLKQYATTVTQPKLMLATRFWSSPAFTASPLLYTAFAAVSNDYTFSLRVFQALQVGALLAGFLLLGVLFRVDAFRLLCFALLCVIFYQPVVSDLRVANLGCLQFFYLTAVVYVASVLPRVPSFGPRRRAGRRAPRRPRRVDPLQTQHRPGRRPAGGPSPRASWPPLLPDRRAARRRRDGGRPHRAVSVLPLLDGVATVV
jgi:hypothetical protein